MGVLLVIFVQHVQGVLIKSILAWLGEAGTAIYGLGLNVIALVGLAFGALAADVAPRVLASMHSRRILMSKIDIIRAWRDEEYRLSLSEEERAQLPESPVGVVELEDAGLGIKGGAATFNPMNCTDQCTLYTRRCDSICVVFSC